MVIDPYAIARERMAQKRDELQAKGYAYGAADGAVEWAYGIAAEQVPPGSNPQEFLDELDRRLAKCERWAKGSVRFAKS